MGHFPAPFHILNQGPHMLNLRPSYLTIQIPESLPVRLMYTCSTQVKIRSGAFTEVYVQGTGRGRSTSLEHAIQARHYNRTTIVVS